MKTFSISLSHNEKVSLMKTFGGWRTLWRYITGLVLWDGDEGRPGGKMIPCGGATGNVGVQGMRRTLPKRELKRKEGRIESKKILSLEELATDPRLKKVTH